MKLIRLLLFFCSVFGFSQVGINTTTPASQLEIKSSNQVTPSNTDGILIPKIDVFPAINPTVAQNGMMVYLTTISGSNQPGFYYWDNVTTSWIAINSKLNADADFYEVGGTNSPDNINDEMYHLGNVVVGRNANFYANNSRLFIESPDTYDRGIVNYRNLNTTSGFSKQGLNNFIVGNCDVDFYGIGNDVFLNGNGRFYGVRNSFNNTGTITSERVGSISYFLEIHLVIK